MAVQSPHYLCLPDLRSRTCGIQEGLAAAEAAFSEPRGEFTSNGSGSRKRARYLDGFGSAVEVKTTPVRLDLSAIDCARVTGSSCSLTTGPNGGNLLCRFNNQSIDVDAMIRLQVENIRLSLEETRRRNLRNVLAVFERRAALRIREKEAELQSAACRNADLHEKVRHLTAENEIWLNVVKNHETTAADLRTDLDQALLRNAATSTSAPSPEGFGDSGDLLSFPSSPAAELSCFVVDSSSSMENRPPHHRRSCKACGERASCVLLLPCRHLCLCAQCESALFTCPTCQSPKNGTLHVILP